MDTGGHEKEIKALKKQIRILEKKIRISEENRTEIEKGNDQRESVLKGLIRELETSQENLKQRTGELEVALSRLKSLQAQLIESEKMSALGVLVAGISHEINNPITFISGNLRHAESYVQDLFSLIDLYAKHYPQPDTEIQDEIDSIELDFIREDFHKILRSMGVGAERVGKIVLSLQSFSRLGESPSKTADIHAGLESTVSILNNRIQKKLGQVEIIRDYGSLPLIKCYPRQLNQVFMNILLNAIDALESLEVNNPKVIRLSTSVVEEGAFVGVNIYNNGAGMQEEVRKHVFDPFFTTKPVGKGTGLGMSISRQIIVEQHRGKISCASCPTGGTTFNILLPIAPQY